MDFENTVHPMPDSQCIDILNPLEVHNWARSLGASRQEITSAVAEVGPLIDKVIEHLSRI